MRIKVIRRRIRRQYSVANRHFTFFGAGTYRKTMSRAAIILAAGAGTRMKSAHAQGAAQGRGPADAGPCHRRRCAARASSRIVVVTAPGAEAVRDYAAALGCRERDAGPAAGHRPCRRGGGRGAEGFRRHAGGRLWRHAAGDRARRSKPAFAAQARDRPGASSAFRCRRSRRLWPGAADAGRLSRPHRRIQGCQRGRARRSTLCNAGCYAADAQKFFRWAGELEQQQCPEGILSHRRSGAGQGAMACDCAVAAADEIEVMGVNSRAELAEAEAAMQDAPARQRAGRWRRHDRAGDGVPLPRHGAGRRCRDRALCGVRPRRDGAIAARASRAIQPSGRRRRWRRAPSSGPSRGCAPAR